MKSSREQFEGWVVSNGYGEDIKCEAYQDDLLFDAWTIWQASREVLAHEQVTTAPFLKVD